MDICVNSPSIVISVATKSQLSEVFIANMVDGEIQRKFLRETITPKKALELAINIEVGIENQLKKRLHVP